MTKPDLLGALAARSGAFAIPGGPTVELRPLKFSERTALMQWYSQHDKEPGAALLLSRKLAALGLDLTEDEVDGLDSTLVDHVAREVAVRTGINERTADEGKASPPPSTIPSANSSADSDSPSA